MLSVTEAALTCQRRRLTATATRHPLIAVVVAAAVLALPVGLWIVGRRAATIVTQILAVDDVTSTFVVAMFAAAVVSGACASSATPDITRVDEQLRVAAAPHEKTLLWSLAAPGLVFPLVWAGLSAGLLLAGLYTADALTFGQATLLLTLVTGGMLTGLAAATALTSTLSGNVAGIAAITAIAAAWVGSDLFAGNGFGGVPGIVAAAVRDGAGVVTWVSLMLDLLVVVMAWAYVASKVSVVAVAGPRRIVVPIPSRRVFALPVASLKILIRRPDLRTNAWIVIAAAPLLAVAIRNFTPIPSTAGLFALLAAVAGSVTCSLAVPAIVSQPRDLWRITRPGYVAVSAALLTGPLCQILVFSASVIPLTVAGLISVQAWWSTVGLLGLSAAAALVAGALAPWRAGGGGSQVTSTVLFGGIAALVYKPYDVVRDAAAGFADPRIVGVASALIVLAAASAAVSAAVLRGETR